MQGWQRVGARVVQDGDRIIAVDCFSESGKDYAAGRHAAEHQIFNLLRAKDDLKIVAAKGAEAILINGDRRAVRAHRIEQATSLSDEKILLYGCAERKIALGDIGVAGPESDPNRG
jgi:hypothetical protein